MPEWLCVVTVVGWILMIISVLGLILAGCLVGGKGKGGW